MNPAKQHKKLERLQLKAEECTTREEAQKIIKKADKVHRKLTEGCSQPNISLSLPRRRIPARSGPGGP